MWNEFQVEQFRNNMFPGAIFRLKDLNIFQLSIGDTDNVRFRCHVWLGQLQLFTVFFVERPFWISTNDNCGHITRTLSLMIPWVIHMEGLHFKTFLILYCHWVHSSWEADSHSASQEIPILLWNRKVRYPVHNSPPLVSVFSQMNPVHTFPPYFHKIHSNIFPTTPGSSE